MSNNDGKEQQETRLDTLNSGSARIVDDMAPDEGVRITPQDKFANLTDEDLRLLLDKIMDRDVEVDGHPELEMVYETYGADYEIMKQELTDEMKRRALQR